MTENEKKCAGCSATTEALGLYIRASKKERSEVSSRLTELCDRRSCPASNESKIVELVTTWIK